MKYKYYYLFLSIIIFSCTEVVEKNNSNRKIKIHTEHVQERQDSIFKQRLLKYNISLNYESTSATEINDESVRALFFWLQKVKKEVFVDGKGDVIFNIETVINKNISIETANKRIEDIVELIDMSIGINAEDIPLVKNIHYFKWGNRTENHIKISLNRLMY